jgi:hypothetical protein
MTDIDEGLSRLNKFLPPNVSYSISLGNNHGGTWKSMQRETFMLYFGPGAYSF